MQKNLFDYISQNQQDCLNESANKASDNTINPFSRSENQSANENVNSSWFGNSSINNDAKNAQHSSMGSDYSAGGSNLSLEEQARAAYQKYQNFSQDELMNEFLKTSKQKMSEGSLTPEKLQNTVNSLSPFLNNSQKEFLKGLISKLDD